MSVSTTTEHLGLPLPHPDNNLDVDVLRLIEAFELLDAILQLLELQLDDKQDAGALSNVDNTRDNSKSVLEAARLAAARTINGTAFNGTANITTDKWGAARSLKIGSAAKNVDGSAATEWTLAEIGAAADVDAVKKAGDQTVAGTKTFSTRSVHAGAYTPAAEPVHSATPTFDCSKSNVFEPAALTGNVTAVTLSNPVAGQTVQIRFAQDATGGRTVVVPAGAKVSGAIATAANRVSWLILTYSSRGARWEGNWLQVPA